MSVTPVPCLSVLICPWGPCDTVTQSWVLGRVFVILDFSLFGLLWCYSLYLFECFKYVIITYKNKSKRQQISVNKWGRTQQMRTSAVLWLQRWVSSLTINQGKGVLWTEKASKLSIGWALKSKWRSPGIQGDKGYFRQIYSIFGKHKWFGKAKISVFGRLEDLC